MPIDKSYIARIVNLFGLDNAQVNSKSLPDFIYEVLAQNLPKQFLPQRGETLALALSKHKIVALAYDRIYRFQPTIGADIPDEICFSYTSELMSERLLFHFLERIAEQLKVVVPETMKIDIAANLSKSITRDLCREILEKFSCSPTLCYPTSVNYAAEFPVGTQQVLTAAIENIALVDEDTLTWEQVLEFRKDTEARAKYRRLVRWIDEELKTKSPAAVQDLIAIRLDDYEWSCKKHGFKTVTGALSCIMDPKFLLAASTLVGASKYAGGDLWAALSGATIAIGGAAVSFGKSYIDSLDERRKDNYEVAYIHDIKKKAT